MSSFENENSKNISQKVLNITRNKKINLANIEHFNTLKFKHFNNFFNNLFHERLKPELINYLQEKNNRNNSIFKNEYLNENINENSSSELKNKSKIAKLKKNNEIINAKLKNIEPYLANNTNNSSNYKSLDKINASKFSKFDKSKSNNKSTNINSQYLSKGQFTIPNISNSQSNISNNKKLKLKLDISPLNNESHEIKKINNFSNTSNTYYFNKTFKINNNQQLPKDAANCLLLFLKRNKKNLERTNKYSLIYQKYENLIDNITENIPDEENIFKKNNYGNILGYFKRTPMEGNDVLDSACLIGNNYNSKSEKERHFQLLNELTKLKGNIDKYNHQKLLYIKDFLIKYNINYSDKQLAIFEKFMNHFDIKKCEKFLEPGLKIKDMILKIFDEEEKFEIENKNIKMKNIPLVNLKTNAHINNNSDIKNNNRGIESYLSHKKIKDKNKYNHEKSLNLSDTNSNLKEMERQKLVEKPKKTYVSNYNLILKDMSKEIEQLETEIITEKQYKNLQPLLIAQKNKLNANKDLFITSNKLFKSNFNNMKYLSPDPQMKIRRNNTKKITNIIIDKLNIKRNYDKVELKDVKRKLKLTEYIIYSKAKDKLKFKEMGKGELYEYTKKKDNESEDY